MDRDPKDLEKALERLQMASEASVETSREFTAETRKTRESGTMKAVARRIVAPDETGRFKVPPPGE